MINARRSKKRSTKTHLQISNNVASPTFFLSVFFEDNCYYYNCSFDYCTSACAGLDQTLTQGQTMLLGMRAVYYYYSLLLLCIIIII